MIKIIQTEFKKLKRFHILLIGLIGMAFPSVLAVFTQSVATTGTNPNFNFQALFDSSIWNSVTIFMPIVFTLIGGYIINREYTDDTLKNIFPIPISFKKLVGGKLLTMAILSLLLGIYSFIVTVIIGKISGLEGLNTSVISKNLFQFIGITICVYISVLPIMAFTSRKEGMYLGGV
ncbi:TPA: ABC transporter permease, partial [Streptococcus agalactiae]|nr:ABC transporter permease [Streptococcus pyogenes]